MNQYIFKVLTLAVFMTVFSVGYSAHVKAASSTNALTHCKWGDIGCNNPPPNTTPRAVTPKPVNKTNSEAQPVKKSPAILTGTPNTSKACNKDLSTPDECWTNCKTEDDITICDIIKLDTFMPEAPGAGLTFTGQIVTKPFQGKLAKGRVMVKQK